MITEYKEWWDNYIASKYLEASTYVWVFFEQVTPYVHSVVF